MRFGRTLIAAAATVMVGFSGAPGAGAQVAGTSGAVTKLASAPPSVQYGALQDPNGSVTFDEQQGVLLENPLVVNLTAPGTYSTFFKTAAIPAGTLVSSHLIHRDHPKRSERRTSGTVTFDSDILGVITTGTQLVQSDFLGAPGTLYEKTYLPRGLEGTTNNLPGPRSDLVTISADRRSVSFALVTPNFDEMRVITKAPTTLETMISDAGPTDGPDPVTKGNDVRFLLTVKNNGSSAVPNVHVIDTLPPGATLKFGPGSCSGTTTVDCALGTINAGASAQVHIVVTMPNQGVVTSSATATPGANSSATETTTVEAIQDGVAKGWVMPGNDLTAPGNYSPTVKLPATGDGAPVVMTQSIGAFCGGACNGATTTVEQFDGYNDPANPVQLTLRSWFVPGGPDTDPDPLTAAAIAFSNQLYVHNNAGGPTDGALMPQCVAPPRSTSDYPCTTGKTIQQPTPNNFVVTFNVLYLSGQITVGRR